MIKQKTSKKNESEQISMKKKKMKRFVHTQKRAADKRKEETVDLSDVDLNDAEQVKAKYEEVYRQQIAYFSKHFGKRKQQISKVYVKGNMIELIYYGKFKPTPKAVKNAVTSAYGFTYFKSGRVEFDDGVDNCHCIMHDEWGNFYTAINDIASYDWLINNEYVSGILKKDMIHVARMQILAQDLVRKLNTKKEVL